VNTAILSEHASFTTCPGKTEAKTQPKRWVSTLLYYYWIFQLRILSY